MATRLDESPRPGGLYYKEIGKSGTFMAVDANGIEIPDAPPRPADTARDLQPHGSSATSVAAPIDAAALGRGIAEAMVAASKAAPAPEPSATAAPEGEPQGSAQSEPQSDAPVGE